MVDRPGRTGQLYHFWLLAGARLSHRTNPTNGTWSVKTVRLILLGLPALYFSFYFLMLFYGPIRKPILPILSPQQFVDIAAVVFGYVLITSFQKK
jgi:hypothetical protein